MARIRGNGKYYFIKTAGDKAQDESIMNKAINILNTAKKFNLKKASDLFLVENLEYTKDNIELPYQEYNLKAFLLAYKRPLAMIASEGIGKETQDREDFEFTNRLQEIEQGVFESIFKNGDSAEFTKYIEREMIDFLQRKGNVEFLNYAYNLSFKIVHRNKWINYADDVKSKSLITVEDWIEKRDRNNERQEVQKKFLNEISLKFDWLLTSKNQYVFLDTFSDGELAKLLLKTELDNPDVQEKILNSARTNQEKFTRLKFFLIPKDVIISKIFNTLRVKEFITVKQLSTILEQEVYLTMKKSKSPFAPFIKDFLEDENITKDGLEFYDRKKINSKRETNVITLPKEKLQELKKIKNKEDREAERLKELGRIETKKRGFEITFE